MKRQLAILLATLALVGCASISDVDPSKSVTVGDGVFVSPQIQWGRVGSGTEQYWTVDGIGLNELHFFTGIEDDHAILNVWSDRARAELGLYSNTMLPNDVMDLVVRTLGKKGLVNVRSSDLAPAPFGGTTGFRFSLTMATSQGLEMRGVALAAQRNGKLDLLLFIAPAEYYFARDLPVVERVFASVQTTG
jgi:hypothetical protein